MPAGPPENRKGAPRRKKWPCGCLRGWRIRRCFCRGGACGAQRRESKPKGPNKVAFRAPKPLDLEGLMNYAARALSGRAYTVSELKTRLKKRAARQDDVETVLTRLKQAGMVNDRRFSGSFAEWRRENQGMGRSRVLRDLMGRRVAPAVAHEAVDAAFEGVDEIAMIEAYLTRKY